MVTLVISARSSIAVSMAADLVVFVPRLAIANVMKTLYLMMIYAMRRSFQIEAFVT